MKKILYFLALACWVFNLIGTTGYCFWYNLLVFGLANVANSVFAFPFIKECYKKMIGNEVE